MISPPYQKKVKSMEFGHYPPNKKNTKSMDFSLCPTPLYGTIPYFRFFLIAPLEE